jgi:hypothetical protein
MPRSAEAAQNVINQKIATVMSRLQRRAEREGRALTNDEIERGLKGAGIDPIVMWRLAKAQGGVWRPSPFPKPERTTS